MVYVIAKTKKTLINHKFENLQEFYVWLHDCCISFGKVEIHFVEKE